MILLSGWLWRGETAAGYMNRHYLDLKAAFVALNGILWPGWV